MSATSLVIVNHPTLSDGMAELLRLADAVREAASIGAGVSVERHATGYLIAAEADYDVPPGVIETYVPVTIPADVWHDPYSEVRTVLDHLAGRTDGDVVATPDGCWWL